MQIQEPFSDGDLVEAVELRDPVAIVRAEPFEARLAAGLTVGGSRLLVIGLPGVALVTGLVGAEAGGGVARLLLGLTMLAATAGTVGALLGRFPRLPFPLAWTTLVVGHAVADGLPGQLDPVTLLTHSLHAVGFHGALVLAGVVVTTFSLARDQARVVDVARFAPAVLGLVVVHVGVTVARGAAPGVSGVGAFATVVFVLGMVARLRQDHRAVVDIRTPGRRGPSREVVLLGLVVAACAVVLLVPTPLAIATAPYALLGGALGEASATRREFRRRSGGRRTRRTLGPTDARFLALWATMLGLASVLLLVVSP